jgi:hypothetical protein
MKDKKPKEETPQLDEKTSAFLRRLLYKCEQHAANKQKSSSPANQVPIVENLKYMN